MPVVVLRMVLVPVLVLVLFITQEEVKKLQPPKLSGPSLFLFTVH